MTGVQTCALPISLVLVLGAVSQAGLVLPYRLPLLLSAVLVLAFVAQSVKISVDTVVQREVADDFRGRVFSVYDTLFNVTYVVALVAAAFLLPSSGRSPQVLVGVAALYLTSALIYARWSRSSAETVTERLR